MNSIMRLIQEYLRDASSSLLMIERCCLNYDWEDVVGSYEPHTEVPRTNELEQEMCPFL